MAASWLTYLCPILCLLCGLRYTHALDNNDIEGAAPPVAQSPPIIAPTPVLGWNSWNFFKGRLNETVLKTTADALVSSGLAAKGYTFVNMDDHWSARDPKTHELIAIPAKFPSALAGIAEYIHGKNLSLGAYIDVGHKTCGGCPGTWGHETLDAQTLAKAGVDFVKSDSCFTSATHPKNHPADGASCYAKYEVFSEALKATGRPIIHSIKGPCGHAPGTLNCSALPGEKKPRPVPCCSPPDASAVSNFRRAAGDAADHWTSMLKILDYAAAVVQHSKPGFFADLDILEIGNGGLTDAEERSVMSLWCAAKSPLLLGNDLSTMTARTLEIVGNDALLQVNQDPLGKAALRVVNTAALQVWAGPLSPLTSGAAGRTVAVLLNLQETAAEVSATFEQLGLPAGIRVEATDLWTGAVTNHTGSIRGRADAHGVLAVAIAHAQSVIA